LLQAAVAVDKADPLVAVVVALVLVAFVNCRLFQ
jgi:hypothetical protein